MFKTKPTIKDTFKESVALRREEWIEALIKGISEIHTIESPFFVKGGISNLVTFKGKGLRMDLFFPSQGWIFIIGDLRDSEEYCLPKDILDLPEEDWILRRTLLSKAKSLEDPFYKIAYVDYYSEPTKEEVFRVISTLK